MRLRFSIRDLLLITAIIALIAGWWIDHQRMAAAHAKYKLNLVEMIPMHAENAVNEGWDDEKVQITRDADVKEHEEEEKGFSHGVGGFGGGGS